VMFAPHLIAIAGEAGKEKAGRKSSLPFFQ
jgi:hypothetical protein